MADEITKHLRPEEIELLGSLPEDGLIFKHLYPILKNLAECRRLMKKHEWARIDSGFQCLECEVVWHSKAILKHVDDCLWAQAIDTGRK